MLNHIANNVLLIITDQLRHDAVGYVKPWIHTPNLNKLAEISVNYTAAYTQSPQCQPSRASLMTGRYPTAHRVWWNSIDLPLSEKTLGNYFKNAGYRTAYFGKAHLNYDDKAVMPHFGFDQSFLYEDWLRSPSNRAARLEYQTIIKSHHWVGEFKRDRSEHHEDVITNEAIEWLQNNRNPSFAVVSFVGPHPPYAAPAPFNSYYNELMSTDQPEHWRAIKSQYYGMITWIDDNIGRILEHVDDNTIIIFTSDHGDILGDHGLFSKGMYAYEGNTRVPLLIRYPGIEAAKYDHLVQTIDILPTLLSAADIPIHRAIQGKNLLADRVNPINEFVLSMIGHKDRIRMIRSGDFKYWKGEGKEYLFDLSSDPHELQNLVGVNEYAGKLCDLKSLLVDALISAEDPSPFPRN